MKFVDEARIHVAAGAGGNGASSFLREPYRPRGGPDGGDGGDGGDVVLRADPSVGTLLELRDRPHVKAGRGGHGSGKRRHGARGADRVVRVPVGTVVYDDSGTLLADLASPGDEFVAARGGRGGRGNARFATPTLRAPSFAERGEPGEEAWLRLELRLLADAGLVGFPNAGKSTLIARISAARPRIADYPFTTLTPNLGVVRSDDLSFTVADIPGLVPGASQGKGLGHRFLRHVSRAAVLVYLVDLAAFDRDPMRDVEVLRAEVEAFDPALASRRSLVVGTRLDAAPPGRVEEFRRRFSGAPAISAVSGAGVEAFVSELARRVEQARAESPPSRGYVRHVVRDDPIRVVREDGAYRVISRRAERAVAVTDLSHDEAVRRLQHRLKAMGVERALTAAGARRGDEVLIGGVSFDFEPDEEPGGPSEA